jgi:nucleotide-binding universal stress UspA family protein
MAYRSLLVHVDDSDATACLDLAARVARSFDAELAGAYLVPTRELTPFTSAMLPDSVVEHRLRDSGEAQARAEVRFREATALHALTKTSFTAPAGRAIDAAILHARYADLTILAQPRDDAPHAAFASDLVYAVLMQAGRPALIVPHANATATVGERVLVAWKESRESARAVADALPFLERASEVVVVSISARGDEGVRETLADKDITAWLARHDIAANVRHEVAEDIDAGQLILSRAADFGVDLIVMGAYSRPRLSEIVLGGVTRLMLESMTIPVLMSH